MDWAGRSVLVTGAGGFIGSHLTERLLGLGAHVRGVVHGNMRGSIGHLAAMRGDAERHLDIFGGNVRDGAFVREAASGVDTIFHLAAITSVKYSYSNPDETVLSNVLGTLNVCNACRHESVRRYVHISSAGVYAPAEVGGAIRETHPVRAFNPYTASKLAADCVVESYHLSYGLPVAICRIFNVYGPRVGKFLVIPSIILQLLRGNELKLGDLTPTRNFSYVDDILDALLLAAESDRAVGEVVNFGSPRAVTIGELARIIAGLMGREISISFDPELVRPRKSEIHRVIADNSKARDLLGWEPRVGLEDGLRRTIDWIAGGGYKDEIL
jgi:nucleoside-diphosphate-sugar epimerase